MSLDENGKKSSKIIIFRFRHVFSLLWINKNSERLKTKQLHNTMKKAMQDCFKGKIVQIHYFSVVLTFNKQNSGFDTPFEFQEHIFANKLNR